MNKVYILSFLVGLSILPITLSGQNKLNYDIHGQYGISNFQERDMEPMEDIANFYTILPSYFIGMGSHLPIGKSRFVFVSGIDLISFAAKNNAPLLVVIDSTVTWDERYYSIGIPLKINHSFEKWIYVNAGLSNIIHIGKTDNVHGLKLNYYTLGFTGGVDFIIKKRLILGATYYKDLLPSLKLLAFPSITETLDISYSFEQVCFKIGYMINKPE